MSSLRLVEGSSNGGDEVGTDMGKGGDIPDDGASDLVEESMKGYGNGGDGDNTGTGDDTGSGGDTGSDGDGIEGSGGEGIWGSGEDHGESGDDGGVDIARSLATSASDYTGVEAGCSSSSSSSSASMSISSSSSSSDDPS
ncbi:hypothetical protein Tco_0208171, partial [Tanacetum coccineum]